VSKDKACWKKLVVICGASRRSLKSFLVTIRDSPKPNSIGREEIHIKTDAIKEYLSMLASKGELSVGGGRAITPTVLATRG